jgi:hypothetical protein
MEHSGTTFLSQMISLHPDVVTGFECGLLLVDAPGDFPTVGQWYDWMVNPVEHSGWGMTVEQRQNVVDSDSWDEAYARLLEYSPDYSGSERWVIDKTPAYMAELDVVLGKVDCPCVITQKPIEYQYDSYRKRGMSMSAFATRFKRYHAGLERACRSNSDRIYRISQTDLVSAVDHTVADVCTFIGIEYDPDRMREDRLYDRVDALMERRMRDGSSTRYPVRSDYEPARVELSPSERRDLDHLERWREAGAPGEEESRPVEGVTPRLWSRWRKL